VAYRRQNKETLSQAQQQQLNEVGFVWNALDAAWEEGLGYLKVYKQREGHCLVPQLHNENGFRLGSWVINRRQDKEKLSQAQQQQLNEVGFVWNALDAAWEEGLGYLKVYKQREGHCRVPQSHKENGFRLGTWVRTQRDNKTMPDNRRQRLDDLGFVWNVRKGGSRSFDKASDPLSTEREPSA
jgi:Helicase associated domain